MDDIFHSSLGFNVLLGIRSSAFPETSCMLTRHFAPLTTILMCCVIRENIMRVKFIIKTHKELEGFSVNFCVYNLLLREIFCVFCLDTLERKHSASREEAAELRATIKSMDREKDELQQQVDEKTEDIMNLEAIKITLVRK